jgi:hypothetical protein
MGAELVEAFGATEIIVLVVKDKVTRRVFLHRHPTDRINKRFEGGSVMPDGML